MVGAIVDEDKIERQRQAKWFEFAELGSAQELERVLSSRPPQDWKGHVYQWLSLKNHEERTAFHIAAGAGHMASIEFLASRGADINHVSVKQETALHVAAAGNHTKAIAWLVERGVPLDAQSSAGETALLAAVSCGHMNVAHILLRGKASVDLPDARKNTPLMSASRSNNVDVAHLLLQHRASIHTTNSMNETPVSYAEEHMTHLFWWHSASEGDVKGLRRLLARQIGSQGDEGWHELGRALYQPKGQDQMKLNLHRTLCNVKDSQGMTGLSLAVQGGHADAAQYLLSQAADIGISDSERETPLHHAARLGHATLVSLLCENNAPLEAVNAGGATSLHIASFLDHLGAVRVLIASKANVECFDRFHMTPLHLAATRGHRGVVDELIRGGASVWQRDQDGKTVQDRGLQARQNQEKPRPRRAEDVADYDVAFAPSKPAETYKVVHSKPVAVRTHRSVDAKATGARFPGEHVAVKEVVAGWAKLPDDAKGNEQWMLIDGTTLGLGKLLDRVTPSLRAQGSDDDDDDEDDDSDGYLG